MRRFFILISTIISLSACSSVGTVSGQAGATQGDRLSPVEVTAKRRDTVVPELIALHRPPDDLWERIRRELTWQDSIEHTAIDRARRNILRQPRYLPVVSERAQLYLYHIVEEVSRRDLPMELALLPLVESMLNPFAASPSRAAGLWQIMPRTGRSLALDQDWWFDGRRDVRASTQAALNYLESLHSRFDNDWMLALAAYNAGKGRVARAQRRNARAGKPVDYWSLPLPSETRAYVPKVIALAQIISQPDAYGARLDPVPNREAFQVVRTGGQVELYRAAKLAGLEPGALRALNPGHLRWATAPDQPHELLLPVDKAASFETALASLDPSDRVSWQHYRIARGDSLIRIARKFDTQVQLLREVNGIRGSRIRAGDTLLIPHGEDWADSLALSGQNTRQPHGYRVRRGDSLSRIAGRFKVSIKDIIAWNSLDPGKYLQPGQKLTLYPAGG